MYHAYKFLYLCLFAAAPPATLFDAVAGYEKTMYGQGYAPPPPTAPPMPEERRPDEEFVR